MRVIYSKTARLFEVAAQSVAIVAGAEKSIETAFQEYGRLSRYRIPISR